MINSTFVLSEQREVIANSSAVKSLVSVLEALKNSQSPLLFYGEKGSGRCFFAKYLHKCSQNCDLVFMRLNCKTLSVDFLTELLETKPGMLHFDEIDESAYNDDFMIEGGDANDLLKSLMVTYLNYEMRSAIVNSYASENILREQATNESLRHIEEIERDEAWKIRKIKNAEATGRVIDSYVKTKYRER